MEQVDKENTMNTVLHYSINDIVKSNFIISNERANNIASEIINKLDIRKQIYAFTDIETLGLSSDSDIIEIATTLCQFDAAKRVFTRIASIHAVKYLDLTQYDGEKLDPWIYINHMKTGLFIDCYRSEKEDIMLNYIKILQSLVAAIDDKKAEENTDGPVRNTKLIMAGSGIHFDKEVIKNSLGDDNFFNVFHYRLFDTTTFLLSSQLLGIDDNKEYIANDNVKHLSEHRAQYDVEKSIWRAEQHLSNYLPE